VHLRTERYFRSQKKPHVCEANCGMTSFAGRVGSQYKIASGRCQTLKKQVPPPRSLRSAPVGMTGLCDF